MIQRIGLLISTVLISLASAAFADDGFSGGFSSNNVNFSHNWNMVEKSEPVRAGNLSQRFEINDDDCAYCVVGKSERLKVDRISNRKFQKDEEAWIAFSLYLVKDFNTSNLMTILNQLRHTKRFTSYSAPERTTLFVLGVVQGNLVAGYEEITGTEQDADRPTFMTNITSANALKGRWTDFMFHAKFSQTGGYLEVYLNGSKIYDVRKGSRMSYYLVREAGYKRTNSGVVALIDEKNMYSKKIDEVKQSEFITAEPASFYFTYGLYVINARAYRDSRNKPLPTQIAYFDEVRVGETRNEVDLRKVKSLEPVD